MKPPVVADSTLVLAIEEAGTYVFYATADNAERADELISTANLPHGKPFVLGEAGDARFTEEFDWVGEFFLPLM